MQNLFELEKKKKELMEQIEEEEKEYRKRISEMKQELEAVDSTLNCSVQGLDLERLAIAQRCLFVCPMSDDRMQYHRYREIWKEAVQYFIEILIDNPKYLQEQYVWVKSYTATPECGTSRYGMGPTWGSIIADIGLSDEKQDAEGDNWLTDEEKDAICYACHLLQNSKMYHTVAEYFRKH